ncbi:PAS domain-containing protein [Sutcliffiella cohnii]
MENSLLIKKQLLQQYVQTHNKTNSITIVNEQKDPFLIVDLQGDILYASRKSETVLGYTEKELTRENANTLLSLGSNLTKDKVTSRVIPFYKKNEPVSTELNVTIIPIYESGKQIGLYLVFQTIDVEEEGTFKAREEWKALNDKNIVATQLVAEFSHYIQYNITLIKGFVELIKRGYGYKEYYKLVESELARLDLVLRELSMLMLSNNRDISMYSMRELLSEVLTLLKHQAYLYRV